MTTSSKALLWIAAAFALLILGASGPFVLKVFREYWLIRSLQSEDFDTAANAAIRLGEMKTVRAVPALIAALEHRYGFVRMDAAEALVKFGPSGRDAVERWCREKLVSADRYDRLTAINLIGAHGMEWAIPQLIEIIGVRDEVGADGMIEYAFQSAASGALSKMGSASLPALKEALKSGNAETRKQAVLSLKWMGPEADETAPLVESLLDDPDFWVRKYAAEALEEIRARKRVGQ